MTYEIKYRDADGGTVHRTTVEADSDDAALTKARLAYGSDVVVLGPKF